MTIPDPKITHILVVIHGAERDAATSLRITAAAAVLAGRIDDTVIVAPRFAARVGTTCTDELADGEVNWPCDVQLGDWRSGGTSVSASGLSSFEVLDGLLRRLEEATLFPNLRTVVIAGHSAGGQFVTNYQMTNAVHDQLRARPSYVTANASIYAYPDDERPAPVDRVACPGYRVWPFGIGGRPGYVGRASDEDVRHRAVERRVTFLVGEADVQPADGGYFGSCAALAQGPTRRERGVSFGAHMTDRYGAAQAAVVVPNCAHSESCMFLSRNAISVLFPR